MLTVPAFILPMLLAQVGPNPSFGELPDYSAEIQDRPPRERAIPYPAGLLESSSDGWLKNCLDLVDTAPSRAHVQAQLRRDSATGAEQVVANYCLGMAATQLALWSDASTAFLAARDMTNSSEPRLRARFGIMAGNAALADGDYSAALPMLTSAQNEAEAANHPQLAAIAAIDQARLYVLRAENDAAALAMADARRLDPASSDAWLLSATLMRRMERMDEAQSFIEKANELEAANPAIALETGLIAVLMGRDDAARASWNYVLAAAPESQEASTAREYLEQIGEPTTQP